MSLFSPLTIDGIAMANRLVRSATGEGACVPDVGCATDAMAAFYGRLAAGGVGLIVTGHTAVSFEGRCSATMSALYSDEFVPAFAKMAEASHAAGAPIVMQLNHGGRQVNPEHKGVRALCPSAVRVEGAKFTPEELTPADVDRIVDDFGQAARRAKEAGFDGVQIHSAHGYLISQFNSPLTNQRTDRWGGSPEKRRAFLNAVYEAMRAHVGDDYPILIKQNVCDFHPQGLTEAEALDICKMVDELGVAAIELSGGIAETIPIAFKAKQLKQDKEAVFFDTQARAIREAVGCPVILTGGIRTVATAERLLADGLCEGVGLCRPLIREPDLPRQWRAGHKAEADCISCGGCKSSPERCNYCSLTDS